ncbi:MAG: hypothetical protein CM1200mP28_02640 [Deltaproteobacteria bacterium]|nr:MAG: hypothetical protein CM1200mP28_02640 [Deltaproteobacteria bacterium]
MTTLKPKKTRTKSKAFSSSILFVPSYRFDVMDDSSIYLRGVLMGDQHHDGQFESKEVLFKQVSIEWEETRKLGRRLHPVYWN